MSSEKSRKSKTTKGYSSKKKTTKKSARIISSEKKKKTQSKKRENKVRKSAAATLIKKELKKKDDILSSTLKKQIKKKVDKYDDMKKVKVTTKKEIDKKKKNLSKIDKAIKKDFDSIKKVEKDKDVKGKIKSMKQVEIISEKQRIMRTLHKRMTFMLNKQIIIQNPINDDMYEFQPMDELVQDDDVIYVHNNFKEIVIRFNKLLHLKGNVYGVALQALYAGGRHTGPINIRHTESIDLYKDSTEDDVSFKITANDSAIKTIFLGFKVVYDQRKPFTKKTIMDLKAYAPVCDRQYHERTDVSTTDSRLCIYESFMHIIGEIKLSHMKRNERKKQEIRDTLEKEGKEIEDCVKNGELIKSLELLTKKYNNEIIVIYFEKKDKPILVTKGNANIIEFKDLKKHEGKQGMLYHQGRHVAPFTISNDEEKKEKKEKKKEEKKNIYKLRCEEMKTSIEDKKINNVIAFDFETRKSADGSTTVFCASIYGVLNDKKINKKYYGKNCIEDFIEYIDSISTEINNEKSHKKGAIEKIHMYGFGNSRFDNFYIYEQLYERQPSMKPIYKKRNIVMMQYNNIKILDLSLYYTGKLESVSQNFGLKLKKGFYPYNFPKIDNLDYIGEVPDKKYFNSKEDYEGCKESLLEDQFDLKKYTIKYCMNDSKMTFEIATKHLEFSLGTINKRTFDIQEKATSSSSALNIMTHCFLEKDLIGSPDEQIEHETEAYKGGYVAIFKKHFKSNGKNRLHYYDLNASYLSSMKKNMPDQFLRSSKSNPDRKMSADEITETDNYLAEIKYVGKNKSYIPNILIRCKQTKSINGFIETDFTWLWGTELIEAINSGCEVRIKQRDMYEKLPIFKEFAEYFYSKRIEAEKNGNTALAKHYKDIGNGWYGKTAQKPFTRHGIALTGNEMYESIREEKGHLMGFEMTPGGKLIYEYEVESDKKDSLGRLIRFASYISACSRVLLCEAIRDIGYEHVYYVDTDSIFTDVPMNKKYISKKKELGKWKIECDSIVEAIFIAPKTYYYVTDEDEKVCKAKGIDSKRLSPEDYKKMLDGEEHEQKRSMFFRSFNNIKILDCVRTVKGIYNKRIFSDNCSQPFENIEEWKKVKHEGKKIEILEEEDDYDEYVRLFGNIFEE